MNKVYSRINWENFPSENTALNEANLNRMDLGLDSLDNRVIEMDAIKVSKEVANTLVKNWTIDEKTGIITIEKLNGEKILFDLNIEKIPVNFKLSEDGILTMTTDDGTKFTANIGAMIPVLTFEDSDEIAVSVSGSGVNKTYSFSIKAGSVTEDKLQPNFLSDVKTEVAKAQASATSAATSETNAKTSETNSKASETAAKTSETNAKASETSAATSASTASTKASEASTSATDAANSANSASASASTAASKASSASSSATTATTKANEASASATSAATSATNAKTSENNAQAYAMGATNSAKYYYEQSKAISESFSGALRPMGTVAFASLPTLASASEGDMYNVSNQFTTTADFKEGSGFIIPAGANVYKTSDGKWDILAGTPVTGVKGNKETTYRRGNVNITPENIGLGNVGDYKAVSTEANQGLTDTEKSNARNNIGAANIVSTVTAGSFDSVNNIGGTYLKVDEALSTAASKIVSISSVLKNLKTNVELFMDDATEHMESTDNPHAVTASQIGALATNGDSKSNTVTFTSADSTSPTAWTDVAALASGEKHSSLFNKISTMFKNVRYLYKMLGMTDISGIGNGTVTGGLSALNSNFSNYQPKGNYASYDHNHDDRYYTESEINSAFAFKLYTGGLFGKYGEQNFTSEAYFTDLLKIVSLHGYFTLSSVSNYQRVLLVQYWVFHPNQLITIPALCHNDGQFAGVVTIDTNGDTYFISRCDYSSAVSFSFNTLYMYV